MFLSKSLKFTIFFSLLISSFQIFADTKTTEYEELLTNGTLNDIKKAMRKDSDFYRIRIGEQEDTILMFTIEKNRPIEIIELITKSGTKLSWKNKNNQTAFFYTCKYSNNDDVIKFIFKKTGSKKSIQKKLQIKDKIGFTPNDYAKQNPYNNISKIIEEFISPDEQKDSSVAKMPSTKATYKAVEKPKEDNNKKADKVIQPIETSTVPVQEVTKIETNDKITQTTETKTQSSENTTQETETQIANNITTENKTEIIQNKIEIKSTPIEEIIPAKEENQKTKKEAEISTSITFEQNNKKTEKQIKNEKKQINENNFSENTISENATAKNTENKKSKDVIAKIEPVPVSKYEKVYLYDYAPTELNEIPAEVKVTDFHELAKIDNPNKVDKNGTSLLMKAAKTGNKWALESLIKSGANIELKDNDGWTALMYAVRYQNSVEIITLLIEHGANVKAKNNFGTSILQITACYAENPEILKKILSYYKVGDSEFFSSFILAISTRTSSIVSQKAKLEIFIDRGIPLNRFHEGKTPLMYAAEFSTSTEIIKLLLDNGAIPSIRNPIGKTAFDFAETNTLISHDEIYWSLNTGR